MSLNSKKRYTWQDAPSWWNPSGEEIYLDLFECVVLHYGGKLIPKSDLIEVVNK